MSGGLLYIAILAMWAVVLIPMWWRGRDQSHPTRSIDRFHGAMRTLSDVSIEAIDPSLVAPIDQRPRLSAIQRRQRVFAGLVGLLLITIVTVALGSISPAAVGLPVALIGLFTVAARNQVWHERQMRAKRAAAPQTARVSGPGAPETASAVHRESAVASTGIKPEMSAGVPSAEPAPAARGVRFDDRTWSASPATLPTYINAPAATRVPRVIDLKTPGAWSARSMLREADEVRSARLAAQVAAVVPEPYLPASFTERFVDDTPAVPLAHEHDEALEQIVRRVVNE